MIKGLTWFGLASSEFGLVLQSSEFELHCIYNHLSAEELQSLFNLNMLSDMKSSFFCT